MGIYLFKSFAISENGANGKSDIEGKAARETVSECGQRASFNLCAFVFHLALPKDETSLRPSATPFSIPCQDLLTDPISILPEIFIGSQVKFE
jgi:hypothetical protein